MNKEQIKNEIQDIIANASGEITSDQIYEALHVRLDPGRTQETIRTYIRELVNDSSALIGSSSNGYFKISTKREALKAIRYIESRIPELEERVRKLRESWNNENPTEII